MNYQRFNQSPKSYESINIKESFKFINEKIIKKYNPSSLLDIGCASGDFLSILDVSIKAAGVDKTESLIDLAKSKINNPLFNIDILKEKKKFQKLLNQYGDAVTILGTLHTFLDFRPLLHEVINSSNTRLIIIHSPFNTNSIDTGIFHRDHSKGDKDFQSAYNIFSIETISDYLKKCDIDNFEFIPFEMTSTLQFDRKYLMNNYHFFDQNGKKYLTNGTGVLFEEFILVINK